MGKIWYIPYSGVIRKYIINGMGSSLHEGPCWGPALSCALQLVRFSIVQQVAGRCLSEHSVAVCKSRKICLSTVILIAKPKP